MAKPGFTWDADDPMARCEGETLNSWAALNDYARMGPGRSLAGLLEVYQIRSDPAPVKAASTIKLWSRDYAWQDRVTAYDEAENERQHELTREWRDEERERRQRLLERAHGMMPDLFDNVDTRKVKPADIAGLVRSLTDASRKETGDDIVKAEHTGKDGAPIQTETKADPRALELLERAIEAGVGVAVVEDDD